MSKKIVVLALLMAVPLILLIVSQLPIYQIYQSPIMCIIRQNPLILIASSAALFIILIMFLIADHKAANPKPQTLTTKPQPYIPNRTLSTVSSYTPPALTLAAAAAAATAKNTVKTIQQTVTPKIEETKDKIEDAITSIIED